MFVVPLKTVYLVDITTLGGAVFTTPATSGHSLGSILKDSDIKKVFFDIRNDSDALFGLYGIRVAGIVDLQLMELASRVSNKRCVNGLAKCIEKDAGLSYSVFGARPLPENLERYCGQDVALMPTLFETYRPKLCDAWWAQIDTEAAARIALSQSSHFNGRGRHMALGPHSWTSWRPPVGEAYNETRSARYAPAAIREQTTSVTPSAAPDVIMDDLHRPQARAKQGMQPASSVLSEKTEEDDKCPTIIVPVKREYAGSTSPDRVPSIAKALEMSINREWSTDEDDEYGYIYNDSSRYTGVVYLGHDDEESDKDLTACDKECGYCGCCMY